MSSELKVVLHDQLIGVLLLVLNLSDSTVNRSLFIDKLERIKSTLVNELVVVSVHLGVNMVIKLLQELGAAISCKCSSVGSVIIKDTLV